MPYKPAKANFTMRKPKPFNARKSKRNDYTDNEWRKLSKHIRYIEPFCRTCANNGIVRLATEVDHIEPLRDNQQ